MIALCLCLLQAPVATVGDTLWVTRAIAAPSGSVLRPLPWELGDSGTTLGPPIVMPRPGGFTVRYRLALWIPGAHQLLMPGPLLVLSNGRTDTLPAMPVIVRVASVLPSGTPDSALSPKGAASVISRGSTSPVPLIVLCALVAAITSALQWRWRRRPTVRNNAGPPRAEQPGPKAAMLRAWAAAGEYRTALDGWNAKIDAILAERVSSELADGVAPLREELDRLRYAPAAPGRLAKLCEEAEHWVDRRGEGGGGG